MKRIEALIAIVKSVDKSQNIPLINIETILKSLFREENKTFEPKLLEAEIHYSDTVKIKKEKTTVYRLK